MTEAPLTEQLPRVHEVLTEALRQIDAACRALGISYWVDSGTLLGAVRHKGLIPWDDDLDLCMLREDIDRFIQLAPQRLGPTYSVQTSADDPAIAPTVKVYINGTHVRSHAAEVHGLPPTRNDGLYADIYVMDRVSSRRGVRRFERALGWLVCTHRWAKYMARSQNVSSARARLRWRLASYVPRWVVALIARFLRSQSQRRRGDLLALGQSGLYSGYTYRRETIFPLVDLPFADFAVRAPTDPHAYLIGEFGPDYMTPLPPHLRVAHTDSVAFDD